MSQLDHTRSFEIDPSFRGLVGVGRRETTPEPGIYSHNWGSSREKTATFVHRPLHVTALSLTAVGSSDPCVIVSLDYCWFASHRLFETFRHSVLSEFGLDASRFLFLLTHSHSVPHVDPELENEPGGDKIPAYREKVRDALREAVAESLATSRPATLSWGAGQCTLARTRDFIDPRTGVPLCGPNPLGIADTTTLVGRVTDDATGAVIATLVNYACHPISLGGGNRGISPDYVGAMRELMEGHTGGAPCLFLHGPSGNQTPRDSFSADTRVADANGEVLGFASISILRALLPPGERSEFAGAERSGTDLALRSNRPYEIDTRLRSAIVYLNLPPKERPSIAELEAKLAQTPEGPDRVRLVRVKQYIENLDVGLSEGFPVWGVRLGQCVFIGTPAEPFTDLQTQLRAEFPHLAIVVTNHTNGSYNYLPPAAYYGTGAYEQDCADFGPGCLEAVIAAAKKLIRELMAT
jgi:hypothetical protein